MTDFVDGCGVTSARVTPGTRNVPHCGCQSPPLFVFLGDSFNLALQSIEAYVLYIRIPKVKVTSFGQIMKTQWGTTPRRLRVPILRRRMRRGRAFLRAESGRSGEVVSPPSGGGVWVFCVKECILVHFVTWLVDIELLISDMCTPAVPWTKLSPKNTYSGGDWHPQWRTFFCPRVIRTLVTPQPSTKSAITKYWTPRTGKIIIHKAEHDIYSLMPANHMLNAAG